ncbi:MAG: DNA mismatch repair endonuclease MutL [Desulfobulbaceae bacterium]|nr:DNA mismatch repair endonuclease MutL [Desulfobulbaceae bacterium]
MSKIRILPENLANQIAAGEVIERPASVVKEFVENSIDAGARNIVVQVEGGGSRLIRIIDDGEGMDQDDMLLSLERHATSKLLNSEQLSSIKTLGFRGEAIPSIASVSRLTITSRIAADDLGQRAEVRFGQLRKVHEMGCSLGTVMEVRDLFGNVPARRKFLKTVRTELSHIEEVIVNSALAFPHLGLTYTVNGKDVWSFSAGVDALSDRVKKIMGRTIDNQLIPVDSRLDSLAIYGFLLPPDEPRSATARLRTFVNNRAVRDRMVSHGVTEGAQGFLMKGRHIAGVLFLEVDPQSIDVNVHPTKQEIRFHQSQHVHQQVVQAVKKAMESYQYSIQHSVFGKPARSEADLPADHSLSREEHIPRDKWQPAVPAGREQVKEPRVNFERKKEGHRQEAHVVEEVSPPSPAFEPPDIPESIQQPEETLSLFPAHVENKQRRFKYVGQFMRSYILCETLDGIVVIDQHAAHERLLFEKMKKEYNDMAVPGQALLFPEIIECTPAQTEVIKKYGEEIKRLGLHIVEFGGGSYAIKAIPAILSHLGPLEITNGVFDHYLNRTNTAKGVATRIEDILAVMACKAAVKAHDALLPEEGEALIRKMEDADIFSHCPHGRPVLKHFSENDIKKWFYR